MLRQLFGAVVGLLYWFGVMIIAIVLGGAGDGWLAPVAVSFPGFLLFPITGILFSIPTTAAKAVQRRKVIIARILGGIIIILDVILVAVTYHQAQVVLRLWSEILVGIPWLYLWGLWHYVVIRIAAWREPHPLFPSR
jgi:hypothetical protein